MNAPTPHASGPVAAAPDAPPDAADRRRVGVVPACAGAALHVQYVHGDVETLLADAEVLALIGFGAGAPRTHRDPRYLHVALQPLLAPAPFEVWRGTGPVGSGRDGAIAYAQDGQLLFGALQVDEVDADGTDPAAAIDHAADAAYAQIGAFLTRCGYPHALRIWNYLDAVTEGAGDDERYRRFCIGRARGMAASWAHGAPYPAATAIGRPPATPDVAAAPRRLQVYFLAARQSGQALENPRQTSAYRYPRQYGPQPPSFARAMLDPGLPLLISGTASVVGHASAHGGDVLAQLDETVRNLQALLDTARVALPALPPTLGAGSMLKAYVKDPADAARIAARLRRHLPVAAGVIALHAEICRTDLLIEIDGFHGAPVVGRDRE